jgi:hypothetical protein
MSESGTIGLIYQSVLLASVNKEEEEEGLREMNGALAAVQGCIFL